MLVAKKRMNVPNECALDVSLFFSFDSSSQCPKPPSYSRIRASSSRKSRKLAVVQRGNNVNEKVDD